MSWFSKEKKKVAADVATEEARVKTAFDAFAVEAEPAMFKSARELATEALDELEAEKAKAAKYIAEAQKRAADIEADATDRATADLPQYHAQVKAEQAANAAVLAAIEAKMTALGIPIPAEPAETPAAPPAPLVFPGVAPK